MSIIERKALAVLIRMVAQILIKIAIGEDWGQAEEKIMELCKDAFAYADDLEHL